LIFVVDDNDLARETVESVLREEGFETRGFSRGDQAMKFAAGVRPRLIVSDVTLADRPGLDFMREYVERFPHRRTPFLFLSTLSNLKTIADALESNCDGFLAKPFSGRVLRAKILNILRNRENAAPCAFRGDFAAISFSRLVRFLEGAKITADVVIRGGDRPLALSFEDGIRVRGGLGEKAFAELAERREGGFEIYSLGSDFSALEAPEGDREDEALALAPLVTEVEAAGETFVIRTEVKGKEILTYVHMGEGIVSRRLKTFAEKDRKNLGSLMQKQHDSANVELGIRVDQLTEERFQNEMKMKRAAPKKPAAAPKSDALGLSDEWDDLENELGEEMRDALEGRKS